MEKKKSFLLLKEDEELDDEEEVEEEEDEEALAEEVIDKEDIVDIVGIDKFPKFICCTDDISLLGKECRFFK